LAENSRRGEINPAPPSGPRPRGDRRLRRRRRFEQRRAGRFHPGPGDGLQLQAEDISVSSGKVVFFLVNSGPSAHDMLIADSTGKTVARSSLVQSGDTFTFTIDSLAAGKYAFYCDVPGHRAAGMEGTLTAT